MKILSSFTLPAYEFMVKHFGIQPMVYLCFLNTVKARYAAILRFIRVVQGRAQEL